MMMINGDSIERFSAESDAKAEAKAKQRQYSVNFHWAVVACDEDEALTKAINGDGELLGEEIELEE